MKRLKNNKLFYVLSINSVSVGISFVLGVFTTRLISTYLGTAGLALIGSFKNFLSMVKSIATVGISNSLLQLVVENKNSDKELSIIYSTFFWIFLSIAALLATTICIFSHPIATFLFFQKEYTFVIKILALFVPLLVINAFWTAIYNGLEKFKKIILIQILSNCFVFLITAGLIYYKKIEGALLAIALSEVIMVLITFMFVRQEKKYFTFRIQRIISKQYLNVLKNFSIMAIVSGVLAPLTLLFIRNLIVQEYSISEAGIWDAVNRLSGFYMLFFTSGLTLYYLPKLTAITTDNHFLNELGVYFKTLVPLFILLVVVVYFLKDSILEIAFSKEFLAVKDILIWQLLGDFFKVLSLAFGFQILVKSMMKKYFFIEFLFNTAYLVLAFLLIHKYQVKGVVQAYCIANGITFIVMLFLFRKILLQKQNG